MALRKRAASDADLVSDDAVPVAETKLRRPGTNAFQQQRLKAINPVITPRTVVPALMALAIIFIPLGAAMIYGSARVQDFEIEYTNCDSEAPTDAFGAVPAEYVTSHLRNQDSVPAVWKWVSASLRCQIQFELANDMEAPWYMFYRLKNFHANHRRYVKLFSEDQLNGKVALVDTIKNTVGQNCQPLSVNSDNIPYYPCGLIANLLFNDTYLPLIGVNGTQKDYPMTRNGTAWSTDKNRFKKTKYKALQIAPPPDWAKRFPNGYNDTNIPDISTWYEFQNWMHPAGLPDFVKIVRRNDDTTWLAGTYQINVGMNWPVKPFKGHKYVFWSTRSVIGGRNPFLGISWVVMGGVCLVVGLAFIVMTFVLGRKRQVPSWERK